VETTFQEVCTHLGVETQCQWSDLAILRTTPALLRLFSLVMLWANESAHADGRALRQQTVARYERKEPTFTDGIAAVRRVLWEPLDYPFTGTPSSQTEVGRHHACSQTSRMVSR
jgi:hypothetical protein